MKALVVTTRLGMSEYDGPIKLEFLQRGVAGYLEVVPLRLVRDAGPPLVATMYVNEQGKLQGLPVNPIATVLARLSSLHDTIVGDVVLVGPPDREGEDTSLAPEWVQIIGPMTRPQEDREIVSTNYAEPKTQAPETKFDLPPDLLTTFEQPGDGPGFAERFKAFLEMPLIIEYKDNDLDGALALANSVRYALGLGAATQLKPGHRGDSSHCVIAETILDGYDGSQGSVSVGSGGTDIGGKQFEHPAAVSQFIHRFDSGSLPTLDVNN